MAALTDNVLYVTLLLSAIRPSALSLVWSMWLLRQLNQVLLFPLTLHAEDRAGHQLLCYQMYREREHSWMLNQLREQQASTATKQHRLNEEMAQFARHGDPMAGTDHRSLILLRPTRHRGPPGAQGRCPPRPVHGGQSLDTSTPTGKLMLTMLGAVAEFERNLMLERQREGIAKAKAEGAYKGRVPTAARQATEVRKLRAEGMKLAEIAASLGIGRSSVYRALEGAA